MLGIEQIDRAVRNQAFQIDPFAVLQRNALEQRIATVAAAIRRQGAALERRAIVGAKDDRPPRFSVARCREESVVSRPQQNQVPCLGPRGDFGEVRRSGAHDPRIGRGARLRPGARPHGVFGRAAVWIAQRQANLVFAVRIQIEDASRMLVLPGKIAIVRRSVAPDLRGNAAQRHAFAPVPRACLAIAHGDVSVQVVVALDQPFDSQVVERRGQRQDRAGNRVVPPGIQTLGPLRRAGFSRKHIGFRGFPGRFGQRRDKIGRGGQGGAGQCCRGADAADRIAQASGSHWIVCLSSHHAKALEKKTRRSARHPCRGRNRSSARQTSSISTSAH
ncbi:MAG: hypothetical protein BWZ10_02366 [candidate division BRC1 bacterium ADurb.BinA364]|nr:MAG: hypothetical protein BWZ10_02366 [candidate division BRC1 bacterium ADurb.BinA364]